MFYLKRPRKCFGFGRTLLQKGPEKFACRERDDVLYMFFTLLKENAECRVPSKLFPLPPLATEGWSLGALACASGRAIRRRLAPPLQSGRSRRQSKVVFRFGLRVTR